MNWAVRVAARAKKELRKFPRKDAQRIIYVMIGMAIDPFHGDIEKMLGEENSWRRRVGSYRIFYEIIQKQRLVNVFKIQRRTSSTY